MEEVDCDNLEIEGEEREGIYRDRREGRARSSGANLRPRVEETILTDVFCGSKGLRINANKYAIRIAYAEQSCRLLKLWKQRIKHSQTREIATLRNHLFLFTNLSSKVMWGAVEFTKKNAS